MNNYYKQLCRMVMSFLLIATTAYSLQAMEHGRKSPEAESHTHCECTDLMHAAQEGNMGKVVAIIVSFRQNLNSGKISKADYLRTINAKNTDGLTALDCALANTSLRIAFQLLRAEAQANKETLDVVMIFLRKTLVHHIDNKSSIEKISTTLANTESTLKFLEEYLTTPDCKEKIKEIREFMELSELIFAKREVPFPILTINPETGQPCLAMSDDPENVIEGKLYSSDANPLACDCQETS